MYTSDEILTLLGRSESDTDVRRLLAQLEAAEPLPRPERGETDIRIPLPHIGLELGFKVAEALPDAFASRFDEGELIFNVVFFTPCQAPSGTEASLLPKGLAPDMSRSQVRGRFGPPEWTSPVMNNDRWVFGDIRVLVGFEDDEASIGHVSAQLAK